METKKNREKSAETLRIPIAFAGLLFSGGLILASFSYQTPIEEELEQSGYNSQNEVVYQQDEAEPEQQDEVVNEPAYVPPPQPVITPIPPSPVPPQPNPPIILPDPPTPPVRGNTITAEPIKFPDVEAEFPGGAVEMQKWIIGNVMYPEISIDMEEQGRVYLSFVVETDGKITGINIEKGVSKDLDREAKRLLRNMPKWVPGEVGGKRVRTQCNLPIVFTLE